MTQFLESDFSELDAHVQSLWDDVVASAHERTKPPRTTKYSPRSRSTLTYDDPYQHLPLGTPRLPDKKYRIIYSDPAWRYSNFSKGTKSQGAASAHYNTMSVAQMSHLPVQTICHPEGTTHFMWATFPLLPDALTLMNNWGFEYKTVAFTWVKTKGEDEKGDPALYSGLGYYTNSNAEIVLLGRTKGRMLERESRSVKQVIVAPVGNHSVKPPEVRERIVQLYGDVPRIEMFARSSGAGFDAWGNQAPESSTSPPVT